jgi:sulfatase maturation enzyme AslB (radical SAM superfamily)
MTALTGNGSDEAMPIGRFVWDLTYACPLRCLHCYSESGRRPARTLQRNDMLRVVDAILDAAPARISFGGGEPLLVRWWSEAARRLEAGGVPVTVFTSGWLMDQAIAVELADSVAGVSISIDGATEAVNDAIRGRRGAFRRAVAALEVLDRLKRERAARGAHCYRLGLEYTVTRSGLSGVRQFVEEMTARFPALDYITFGAVVPEGLAQEEAFAERELLRDEEVMWLQEAETDLAAGSLSAARVSVTDARYFLPSSPLWRASAGIAHLEPDGAFRAFTNYEAKIGNILEEPVPVLWERALAWRADPFVAEQFRSIRTVADWARASRALDRQFGSESDRARIARRGRYSAQSAFGTSAPSAAPRRAAIPRESEAP